MNQPFRALIAAPALALAACGGESAGLSQKAIEEGPPRVIVAVVDSAMNPYHEFFYAGSPIYQDAAPAAVTPEVLAEIGVAPEREVTLTRSGNLRKDLESDAAFWGKVRRGRPYWFRGTNLIGVSFCDEYPTLIPDSAKNPHGVGTSAAVLRANPEAVVLFVEFCESIGSQASHDYAFYHPAVDILSSSYGYSTPVGAPIPLPLSWSGTYDAVVNLGKLHFQAAGNGPGFTPGGGGPGNWWAIGVTGFEEGDAGGQTVTSSNVADFVSDYTQELPYCQDCERGLNPNVGGTSFSTPRAAGVASRVLLEARRALGHGGGIRVNAGAAPAMVAAAGKTLSNWQLRRALEEAAYADYVIADYAASGDALPILDLAPWVQLGWGDLTADPEKGVVRETLAQLGLGTPTRSKGAGFCEYQAGWMRFRQSYWDATGMAMANGEVVPQPNPYIYCGTAVPTP